MNLTTKIKKAYEAGFKLGQTHCCPECGGTFDHIPMEVGWKAFFSKLLMENGSEK